MEPHSWTAVAASVAACLTTIAGILTVRRFGAWARANTTVFASFAAGTLVAVSFLHIVPASFAMSGSAPAFLLAGYLSMYAFNRFVTAHVCERPQTADYALGLVPMLGIGFHSLLDGVIYSIGFSVSQLTGGLMALGMVLHEFPEGIVTYVLLLRGGFSERRSFVLAFLAAALTTPVGTLLSCPLVDRIGKDLLGVLLALSAGALIYIGASHLLPQADREPAPHGFAALAAGVVLAIAIVSAHG